MKKLILFNLILFSSSAILFCSVLDLSFLDNISDALANKELSNLVIYVENIEQELICESFSDYLENIIMQKIIQNYSNITLVERNELKKVENELLLQCNGLFDDESVVYLGHLTGAQAMLNIKYTILDDEVLLNMKTIDIEKGEVLYINNEKLTINEEIQNMLKDSVFHFYATGIGQEPDNAKLSKTMKRQMAKRVAVANSYRNLIEIVKGAYVKSITKIDNMTIDEDKITIESEGYLANAEVVETNELEDGVYQVKTLLELPYNKLIK